MATYRTWPKLIGAALIGAVVLAFAFPTTTFAHSLGIDPVVLVEQGDFQYLLKVKIPPKLAQSITTVTLPNRCKFSQSPSGTRSKDGVHYQFSCTSSLTHTDRLVLPWDREGVMMTVIWKIATSPSILVSAKGGKIVVELDQFQAASTNWWSIAYRYLVLGFEHIIQGIDHLLFVLGLVLIVGFSSMLIKTITAFTIAHSITLALAALKLINVPPAPVEAVIVLSVMLLAVEVLKHRSDRPSLTYRFPWLIAFTFGLVHGLGFAGALSEIGLPASDLPVALLFFNIGVEIGQILFVCILLTVIWIARRSTIRQPVWAKSFTAYFVGVVATFWFIERMAGSYL